MVVGSVFGDPFMIWLPFFDRCSQVMWNGGVWKSYVRSVVMLLAVVEIFVSVMWYVVLYFRVLLKRISRMFFLFCRVIMVFGVIVICDVSIVVTVSLKMIRNGLGVEIDVVRLSWAFWMCGFCSMDVALSPAYVSARMVMTVIRFWWKIL